MSTEVDTTFFSFFDFVPWVSFLEQRCTHCRKNKGLFSDDNLHFLFDYKKDHSIFQALCAMDYHGQDCVELTDFLQTHSDCADFCPFYHRILVVASEDMFGDHITDWQSQVLTNYSGFHHPHNLGLTPLEIINRVWKMKKTKDQIASFVSKLPLTFATRFVPQAEETYRFNCKDDFETSVSLLQRLFNGISKEERLQTKVERSYNGIAVYFRVENVRNNYTGSHLYYNNKITIYIPEDNTTEARIAFYTEMARTGVVPHA